MTILECIDQYVNGKDDRIPIFTNDIYNYVVTYIPDVRKDVFNEYLTRYSKRNAFFIRYQKGIYYKTVVTPFGNAGINYTELVKRVYLCDGNKVFGYETGASFMNKIGLTTQIPTCTYIATEHNRIYVKDNGEHICLLKPIVGVTRENYRYLQFLDLIDNRMKIAVEVEDDTYKNILRNFIELYGLNFELLLHFGQYYKNDNIYHRLAELARGELRV